MEGEGEVGENGMGLALKSFDYTIKGVYVNAHFVKRGKGKGGGRGVIKCYKKGRKNNI